MACPIVHAAAAPLLPPRPYLSRLRTQRLQRKRRGTGRARLCPSHRRALYLPVNAHAAHLMGNFPVLTVGNPSPPSLPFPSLSVPFFLTPNLMFALHSATWFSLPTTGKVQPCHVVPAIADIARRLAWDVGTLWSHAPLDQGCTVRLVFWSWCVSPRDMSFLRCVSFALR